MNGDVVGLLWLVVLLAANAFFVAGEFAVMGARRAQIEPRAEAGSRQAQVALYAMEHVSQMLAVCQLGITVCSLLILNVSEPALHHLLVVPMGALGVPAAAADVTAFVLALLVVTFLHVTLGEMVPKNISISSPESAVRWLAPPLVQVSRLFGPVVTGLNGFANWVLHRLGVDRDTVSRRYRGAGCGAHQRSTPPRTGSMEAREGTRSAIMPPSPIRASDCRLEKEGSRKWTR